MFTKVGSGNGFLCADYPPSEPNDVLMPRLEEGFYDVRAYVCVSLCAYASCPCESVHVCVGSPGREGPGGNVLSLDSTEVQTSRLTFLGPTRSEWSSRVDESQTRRSHGTQDQRVGSVGCGVSRKGAPDDARTSAAVCFVPLTGGISAPGEGPRTSES